MKKGFTMIEIVIVISMILVASSILIGSVTGVMKRNQAEKEDSIKEAVAAANTVYVSDHGACAPNVTALTTGNYLAAYLIDGYTITFVVGQDCETPEAVQLVKS